MFEFREMFKDTFFNRTPLMVASGLLSRIYKTESKSSRPNVFYKKAVLRNFGKFTEKHLC